MILYMHRLIKLTKSLFFIRSSQQGGHRKDGQRRREVQGRGRQAERARLRQERARVVRLQRQAVRRRRQAQGQDQRRGQERRREQGQGGVGLAGQQPDRREGRVRAPEEGVGGSRQPDHDQVVPGRSSWRCRWNARRYARYVELINLLNKLKFHFLRK